MTNKVTVEIDLDEAIRQRYRRYDLDGDGVEEPADLASVVVEAAAFELLRDEEVKGAKGGLIRRVNQIRDEEIRAVVQAELAASLLEPYQPTDSFGSPKGEPTSLRAEIAKQAQAAIATLTGTDSRTYHRDRQPSLVEKLVKEELGRTFEQELRAALNEAKQQVTRAAHAKAARMLAGTIADMAETVAERGDLARQRAEAAP